MRPLRFRIWTLMLAVALSALLLLALPARFQAHRQRQVWSHDFGTMAQYATGKATWVVRNDSAVPLYLDLLELNEAQCGQCQVFTRLSPGQYGTCQILAKHIRDKLCAIPAGGQL